MKRIITGSALFLLLAAPVAVAADPSSEDRQNAARECRALRAAMGAENFRNAFGTNRNKSNAFGKCVSRKAREEASERRDAQTNAARQCRAERAQSDDAFKQKYGTNRNRSNAYGKCVSQRAKENKAAADKADQARVNAARACRAEQKSLGGSAFNQKYGTNRNDRNAFGKCVSAKARA